MRVNERTLTLVDTLGIFLFLRSREYLHSRSQDLRKEQVFPLPTEYITPTQHILIHISVPHASESSHPFLLLNFKYGHRQYKEIIHFRQKDQQFPIGRDD